ncbi:hypothetical protein N9043_00620 [bacterium]|nr:hypothetical protein [bacterium]
MNKGEYEFAKEACESSWFKAFGNMDEDYLIFSSMIIFTGSFISGLLFLLSDIEIRFELWGSVIILSVVISFCCIYINAYYHQLIKDYNRIKDELQ